MKSDATPKSRKPKRRSGKSIPKSAAAERLVRLEDVEEVIRQRAYYLWEHEGRPEGREAEHWHRARAEVHHELQR